MTRVLVIEPAGGLWGSERALLDFVGAAPELEIAVCCPPASPLVAELERRGVRVLPFFIAGLHEAPRWRRLQAAFGVARACATFRPDVIHLNQSGVYKIAAAAAAIFGLPLVCHVRIFEDAAYLARQNVGGGRLKVIVAISQAIEDEIRQFPTLRQVPVRTVYDAFVPRTDPAGEAAPRIPGRVACVGRIAPIKGQELLLRALADHDDRRPSVECLIVGDGEPAYVERLKAITPAPDGARVSWTGFVEDVGPLLEASSALICPSIREPLGRVIFEAWDCGAVPVVFAGSGGAAEIVAAAGGGLLYAEQTPERLGAAIAEALALSGEEAARLVGNGREWMAEHCAAAAYGRTMAAILSEAARKAASVAA